MRKIRSLTGMPVLWKGKKLGRLVQAELSKDLGRMEGIWVDCGLMGTRYITADHLSMIGELAVHSDDKGLRRRCNAAPLLLRAISTDGARIGAAVGAEIDELSFIVTALEITHGIWDDLYHGRSRCEAFTPKSEKNEVILANPANANPDVCVEGGPEP